MYNTHKANLKILFLLVFLLSFNQSCENDIRSGNIDQHKCVSVSKEKVDTVEWKKDVWQCIYFNPIKKLSQKADVTPLKGWNFLKFHTEIRIWISSIEPMNALIIENKNSYWLAHWLTQKYDGEKEDYIVQKKVLIVPSGGWKKLLEDFERMGLYELPDSVELKDDGIRVLDGVSYVIEIQKDNKYKTILYSNPSVHIWPEAKKVVGIIDRIRNAFYLNPHEF